MATPAGNDNRSRPIFTWVAAVAPGQWHDRGMEEAGNLRDCARRSAELASRCPDQDVAKILLDVADDLEHDARYIERLTG